MKFWIGTSGYSYDDWIGRFYPPQIKKTEMLPHYAQRFPICELNYTYYRMPTMAQMKRFVQRAPGLNWIIKLHGDISHRHQESQIKPFLEAIGPVHDAGYLRSLLLQFPQSFHRTDENRLFLQRVVSQVSPFKLHVEFRHRSWDVIDLSERFCSGGVNLVSVDAPNIPALFPRRLLVNQEDVFVRFHSRAGANWYEGEKERYDYDYQADEFNHWLDPIEELRYQEQDSGKTVYLIFNNCHRGQAAANAERIEEIIEERFGAESIVKSESTFITQRELFDGA